MTRGLTLASTLFMFLLYNYSHIFNYYIILILIIIMYIYRLLLKYTKEKIQTWRCLCIQLSLIWRTAVKAWMTVRSPTFFLPLTPFAQNAIYPGYIHQKVFFIQGQFALILCMNNILWSIIGACVKDNAFLVIGSQICKILKIWTVHCLHLLIYLFLRSKQLHLKIIIAIFKTVQLPKSK